MKKTPITSQLCDRLISETNASGKPRSYTYDPVGNRTGMTDRNGKTRRFNYDPLDRLTSEEWLSGGTTIRTTNSSYDAVGQLTSITDPDASYSYTYDLDGRLLTVNNAGTAVSPSVLMTYGYDAAGNVLSASDNINGVAKGTTGYSYDAKDRLTSIQQSGAGVANKRVDYTYNAVGQPLTTKRYSDLAGTQVVADSNLTYDALSRPTNMTHSKGGVNTAFYNYTYDANSRITNVSNKDGTSAYTYDDVDQLTGANYSFQPSESYTYDLNGNRTNAGYQTGLNNRLLSDGTFNYEYDNEGNLTKQTDILTGEVTQNTWDYRNRLTNVTRNGVAVGAYTYDTYDQRIGKTANGTTERFVYGQNQNIALEFDGGGAQTHRYLHGNGIDQVLADEASGTVGWTLSDNLGTVRDVVDGSGSSQNHIAYNSFGNVTSESNPSFDTRFSFTGRELDAETGNYDYRNRQYNPRSGRFIEEDPIGFGGGDANLYRYVGNSPINYTDSKGYLRGVPFPVPVPVPTQIPFAPLLAPFLPFLPLLFPEPTAQPWQDTINPITGTRYKDKEEYDRVNRDLTREQLDILKDRRTKARQYFDKDFLKPDPNSCDDKGRRCQAGDIPGHLGSATSPASGRYATYVSQSPNDYFVFSQTGGYATYDGKTPGTRTVWEAKLGQGYLNYDLKTLEQILPFGSLRDDILKKRNNIEKRVKEEIPNEKRVAGECKYTFKIACSDPEAAQWFKKTFPDVIVEWKPWFRGKQKSPGG